MKRYSLTLEDRRPDGGPWVCYIRRPQASSIAIGVGASRSSRVDAIMNAIDEVRYRRKRGMFRPLVIADGRIQDPQPCDCGAPLHNGMCTHTLDQYRARHGQKHSKDLRP